MTVCGRIGAESNPMWFGGIAHPVENAAGLDRSELGFDIDIEHIAQILREIHDDSDVAALPGEAGAAAAREQRGSIAMSESHGGHHVVDGPRHYHANRHLAIVRGIGGIQRSAAIVETNFAGD